MRSFKVKNKAFSTFFLLVLVPFLLFGVCLSSDCARVIMASHTASTLADNIVMAASTGLSEDNVTLDTTANGLVYARATQMFNVAKDTGMVTPDISQYASLSISSLTPSNVTITVKYKIKDLILFNYFAGTNRDFNGTVSRSAGPCLSNPGTSCAYLA